MNLILSVMPWKIIRKIVLSVLEIVVERTDNEYDNQLLDVVARVIDETENDNPDED